MAEKLIIPSPNEENAGRVFWEVMLMTWLICGVMLLGLLQLVILRPLPRAPTQEQVRALKTEKAKKRADVLHKSHGTLDVEKWTLADVEASLDYGTPVISNIACEHVLKRHRGEIKSGPEWTEAQLDTAVDLMIYHIKKRSVTAPLSCLVRAWFRKKLVKLPKLDKAVAEFWEANERGEIQGNTIAFMVEQFQRSRNRPEDERFYRWLRSCAMSMPNTEWGFCARILQQLNPKQGKDYLGMVSLHLDEASRENTLKKLDFVRISKALGNLSRLGQPNAWKITRTKHLARYDYDLRIGSIFLLCRMVNSPDMTVALAAASGLAKASDTTTPGTQVGVNRWKATCRSAFGGQRPNLKIVDKPIVDKKPIAILRPRVGDNGATLYGFDDPIAQKLCTLQEHEPNWYCGVKLWKSYAATIHESLTTLFVDTRYYNWVKNEADILGFDEAEIVPVDPRTNPEPPKEPPKTSSKTSKDKNK